MCACVRYLMIILHILAPNSLDRKWFFSIRYFIFTYFLLCSVGPLICFEHILCGDHGPFICPSIKINSERANNRSNKNMHYTFLSYPLFISVLWEDQPINPVFTVDHHIFNCLLFIIIMCAHHDCCPSYDALWLAYIAKKIQYSLQTMLTTDVLIRTIYRSLLYNQRSRYFAINLVNSEFCKISNKQINMLCCFLIGKN